MSTTRATEDYLKTIYGLASSGQDVTTGALAVRLGVSSPSVSAMLKRLEAADLLERPKGSAFRLTEQGEGAALRVVRRHRLLEAFLVHALDMTWDEVHAEAELLEHALSERLEERIDAALGYPSHDPHGDPIPPRHGPHEEGWGCALSGMPADVTFRVERVADTDSEALRYLGALGIVPGVVLTVREQEPFGGSRWVELDGQRYGLSAHLVRLVHGQVQR